MWLFNTLSRKKEEFIPLEEGQVKMYTCGQTIYESMHIGNARTYSTWDILKRYLLFKGYKVYHVQNFTDVGHLTDDADSGEDKIEKKAREIKVHPMAIVDHYIRAFWEDYKALNIIPPDIAPRATGHIFEMIELIKVLLEKGYAYERNGSVYFDVSKFPGYAKMAGMNLNQLRAGIRVGIDPNKDDPLDFALWLKAPPNHIMKWQSPWSLGYPGWHIECSAMAIKYLGETFDIHGGGEDHIFPHHPNERAQSEAATGKTFARYWLHVTFLRIDGTRMGKSLGNIIPVHELVKEYNPNVLRVFFALKHYRKPLDFSKNEIAQAESIVRKLSKAKVFAESKKGGSSNDLLMHISKFEENFVKAMDDDLNTPLALQHLIKLSNRILSAQDAKKEVLLKARDVLINYSSIFGLNLKTKWSDLTEDLLKILIKTRNELRKQKLYALADLIRNELSKLKISLEDQEDGTIVTYDF